MSPQKRKEGRADDKKKRDKSKKREGRRDRAEGKKGRGRRRREVTVDEDGFTSVSKRSRRPVSNLWG